MRRQDVSFRYLPVVLWEKKILYCLIPKTGSTSFLGLMRKIAGKRDWRENPHFLQTKNATHVNDRFHWYGLDQLQHFSKAEICEIMLSPEWKRIVVVRDPARRLLSAWQNKIRDGGYSEPNLDRLVSIFGVADRQALKELTFEAFVNFLYNNRDRSIIFDVHWLPQVEFCGLKRFGKAYQYQIRTEEMSNDTRHFLEDAGLWDSFGKNYTGDGRAVFEENLTPFSHNYSDHIFAKYFNQQLLEKVLNIYHHDYELLNYEPQFHLV